MRKTAERPGSLEDRGAAPLAVVTRNGLVESLHRGHVAVVDGAGRLVARLGDPEAVTYLRSSAKPFQALPLLTTGAADRFGFTDREVALACGSHGGEALHTEAVTALLGRLGLGAGALQCGPQVPYDERASRALEERGESPSVLHNNCSGKHAGMLALALHLGAPTETYREPDHPVQRHIRDALARLAGLPPEEVGLGVDGCGVPTFAVSVRAMALLYARLMHPPETLDEATRAACTRLVRAMTAYPEMVEGTDLEQSLDTVLMRALPGVLVSKVGAEGVYTAGVLPGPAWPHGLGIAFKIEDGDPEERARGPVAVALLRRLGLLRETPDDALAGHAAKAVYNHLDACVGQVRPTLEALAFERDGETVPPGEGAGAPLPHR